MYPQSKDVKKNHSLENVSKFVQAFNIVYA